VTAPARFAKEAFGLTKMQISEAKDLGDGYYVLQVVEEKPAVVAEFATVKEKVGADLLAEKQEEKAKSDSEAFLAALKNGETIDALKEKFGVEMKATGFFNRNRNIPEIGYESEVNKTAFSLSDEKKYPETPIHTRQGYFVIAFFKKEPPDAETFAKEKKDTQKSLLSRKQRQVFDKWVDSLKAKSEIEIFLKF